MGGAGQVGQCRTKQDRAGWGRAGKGRVRHVQSNRAGKGSFLGRGLAGAQNNLTKLPLVRSSNPGVHTKMNSKENNNNEYFPL